jgi:hypothetical protein
LKPAVGTREALGDLPRITEHVNDPQVIRRRRLTDELPYRERILEVMDDPERPGRWDTGRVERTASTSETLPFPSRSSRSEVPT